jgi:hypothetical protein
MANSRLKKTARHLLATTCLIAGADASTITEGTPPAPADFSSLFVSAFSLPFGTTLVTGSIPEAGGVDQSGRDYFRFIGLTPGIRSFTVGISNSGPMTMDLTALNSSNQSLGARSNSGPLSVNVPSDGIVVFLAQASFAETGTGNYSVGVDASAYVPEPAATALAATGLAAAALASQRKKR